MHSVLDAFEAMLIERGFSPYYDKDGDIRVDLSPTHLPGIQSFACVTCDKEEDTGPDAPQFFHLSMFTAGIPIPSQQAALEFLDWWNKNKQMLKFVTVNNRHDLLVSECHGYMRPSDCGYSGTIAFLAMQRGTYQLIDQWLEKLSTDSKEALTR